ncbi:MAG: hypothetical protein NVSMB3_09790 [Acidobacteriaceae bacterium]
MIRPDRRSFTMLLGATLFGATLVVHGQGKSQEHGHGHGHEEGDDNNERDQGNEHGNGRGHGNGHGKHGDGPDAPYFREQDYGSLSRYYNGPRDLPPGLRKKYYRTGSLPPGWEKRFQPMPPIVLQQLPPLPSNYQRGYLDGYAVVVDPRTRVVVDAVDILHAVTGR